MSEQSSTKVERVCWLCEYATERGKRNPDAWMIFLFVAAMSYEKQLEALCDRHRAAWEYMAQRKKARPAR